MSTSTHEWDEKWRRLRALLDEHDADAIHLARASSFAWATGGCSSVINTASDRGEGSLLVERDRCTVLASSIEAPRYRAETELESQGWTVLEHAWTAPPLLPDGAPSAARTLSDVPADPLAERCVDLAPMRAALLDEEHERLRELGHECGAAMWETCTRIRRGEREHAIAARLAGACLERAIEPIVTLVASDERVRRFRHPRPTDRAVSELAMVVLCGRRDGLVVSLTRLVHFGPLPPELDRRHRAVCDVDARMLATCRPGRTLGDVFAAAQAAYDATGFPDEWRQHHQGGLAGYEPREVVATPDSDVQLVAGHACAFNPSIAGTKSEDTVLVREDGPVEVLTAIPNWPVRAVDAPGPDRPDVLVL